MAIDYAALAATAKRLVEANGRSVTIRKRSRTPADGSKPWRGTTSQVDTSVVTAVLVPFESKDVDGELIRRDDMMCIIAASSTNVSAEDLEDYDSLLDGSTIYKIVNTKLYEPGDTRLVYVIQLRR